MTILAPQLGTLRTSLLLIEGHTDAKPFAAGDKGYSNWDLSADRANAARKFLQQHGVRPDQVRQVRGFADQNLRNKANPNDASNRRVSVIVQYLEPEALTQVFSATKMAALAGQTPEPASKPPAANPGAVKERGAPATGKH